MQYEISNSIQTTEKPAPTKRGRPKKRKNNSIKLPPPPPPKVPRDSAREKELAEHYREILMLASGFERSWTPEVIKGMNMIDNEMVFLMQWTNGRQTIEPTRVAKVKCPQLVIQFYEKHINWDSDSDQD